MRLITFTFKTEYMLTRIMKMNKEDAIEWCKSKHRAMNQKYDGYLPYEFHLNLTGTMGKRWIHLIPVEDRDLVEVALYAHDLIEDTDQTYNDVRDVLGEEVAEIAYALTKEKGRNRKQRASGS